MDAERAISVTDERIVLSPEMTYVELNSALAERGWVWTSGPSTLPLVPDEPELTTWRHDTAGSLVYTCNPVVWLRLLDLAAVTDPSERVALALGLPQLESEEIGRVLRSGDVERTLLGVLAAEVLDGTEHLSAIRALMHHRDPSVARAAVNACVRLA